MATPDEATRRNLQAARSTDRAEHRHFLEAYQAGQVQLGIDRSWVVRSVSDELIKGLLEGAEYPRKLAGLAAGLRNLMIPAFLVGATIGVLYSSWAWIGGLVGVVLFHRLSYRYQREALRQLALVDDPAVFATLEMLGVVVVKGSVPEAAPPPSTPDAPKPKPAPESPTVCPGWDPIPEMRLLFDENAHLMPDVDEWDGDDRLDVDPVHLVPVWYPSDYEGEPLPNVKRAEWFRNELRIELELPRVYRQRGTWTSPPPETLTPEQVRKALFSIHMLRTRYHTD